MSDDSSGEREPGYGKILDAWDPPKEAGDPIGCVATSFTFSSVHFEEECLSRFLGIQTEPKEDGLLYVVEREEKLSQVYCAALVDSHHCRGPRSLRWDLIPSRPENGILHAKVSLLWWTKHLRLIVGSANLTPDGYRRNLETFGVLDYHADSEAPLPCLRTIVDFLTALPGLPEDSPSTRRWREFLGRVKEIPVTWGVEPSNRDRHGIWVDAVVSGPGRSDVLRQMTELWPSGSPPNTAYVVSPFFDLTEDKNKPATALWNSLKQKGEAEVFYNVTGEEVPGTEALLLHAPESLRIAEPTGRSAIRTTFCRIKPEESRSLHAKQVWLDNGDWAIFLLGSSNFTSAGLGLSAASNLEANLLYRFSGSNSKVWNAMGAAYLDGDKIDRKTELRWLARTDMAEDESNSEEVPLPKGFLDAMFISESGNAAIEFSFLGRPPAGWSILTDDGKAIVFNEEAWQKESAPSRIRIPWTLHRPPMGFLVQWKQSTGRAWWPVNIKDAGSLPPPDELRDLPLEVLIDILTSARPLHEALRRRLTEATRTSTQDQPQVDPHARVDTRTFLLQRTRRISWALRALRQRLERPIPTRESLEWRIRGPVGVATLAVAILREARSDEESAFLTAELALELSRVRPHESPGTLTAAEVRSAIHAVIVELRRRVTDAGAEPGTPLRAYLDSAFASVNA